METFTTHQPDEYMSWADKHWRDGYVLTQRGKHRMIHVFPRCSHIYGPWQTPRYHLIDKPRRCSLDEGELVRLARDETGGDPVYCQHCEGQRNKFAAHQAAPAASDQRRRHGGSSSGLYG